MLLHDKKSCRNEIIAHIGIYENMVVMDIIVIITTSEEHQHMCCIL